MDDRRSYLIQLGGQVDANEVNALGPREIRVLRVENATTLLTVDTDQAGLIGLLRHLHGRGFELLSVRCE